ncbi:hypothetical protein OHR68_34410 [Spirillospora sp. NBC_00431]
MVGVDHTSGTDTKTETTDQPQTSDDAYQPPPDRPGSPGQPSRAESRAAARAPAETEEPDEPRPAETASEGEPRRQLESDDDGETTAEPETDLGRDAVQDVPRGPRAESWARARGEPESSETETEDPAPETGETEPQDGDDRRPDTSDARTEEPSEPGTEQDAEPAERPSIQRGPRAESWARATEAPDEQDEQTGGHNAPDQEPHTEPDTLDEPAAADAEDIPDTGQETDNPEQRPADRDDPQPSPEPEERPDENSSDTGNGNDDRGRNAEDQPESPAPEETETDRFAGLPTRADLDPSSAGELTRERGEPLTPVNENQDLREPDPERDSDWRKALRSMNSNDFEDAFKETRQFSDMSQTVLDHKHPSEYPTGTRDAPSSMHAQENTISYPDVVTGAAALAFFVWGAAQGISRFVKRSGSRDGNNG